MDHPPYLSLSALLAASRLGSLTAAAEELGVTHGAISRRIQALESWLGTPVFERHGRGVRLTPAGAQFTRRVDRSIAAITTAASDIKAGTPHAPVKVSVLPSFARLWLIPHIPAIEGAPADLTLRIQTDHALANIDGRESDIAIRSGYGDWSGVMSLKLFSDRLFPVAIPALAAQMRAARQDVMDLPLLLDGDTSDWKRWSRARGCTYAPRAGQRRFDDYDMVIDAAKAGVGAALARLPLADDALADGSLVRLDDTEVEIGRGHWLVFRQAEDRPAVLRAITRIRELTALPEKLRAAS